MKWIFLGLVMLISLPFLVKLIYMSYILYKHYFFSAINSKYPIPHKFLSKLRKGEEEEEQQPKRIGFDTSFTEEDKQRLEARRSQKKR
jgi:hypothetical protein